MAKQTRSLFTTDQGKVVALKVEIKEALRNRIDAINQHFVDKGSKSRFDVEDILAGQVERLVERAEKELGLDKAPMPIPKSKPPKKDAQSNTTSPTTEAI